MNPEDFSYFQSRVTRFISGSNSGIKFGSSVTPRYTRLSSIIPGRALPQQILNKSTSGDNLDTSSGGVSALGRVTLNLEQTKNNLERIFQIIADDYKSSKEQNRKEIDEYRKRIANRGRIFGKRELGDKKSDVLGTIKKYVGSFFSGAGGAIRALAMFNLLQGLLSGDPSKIIGPLLGIGLTYIPSIIGGVIGSVIGGVGKSLVGRMFGGGARAAGGVAEAGAGASKLGKLGKFGGKAALIGSGLALASRMFNKPQEEDQQQQRLQQLTEQQKGLVAPQSLGSIPGSELRRFDNLNKKFEAALDFLLKKQKEGGTSQGRGSGGQGGNNGGGGAMANPYDIPGLNVDPGSIASKDQFRSTLKGTPMESEADSIYEMSLKEGLNPAFVAGLAGAESSFGSAGISVGTKNPFGILHQGFSPKSYAEATQYLARHLRNPQGPYAGMRTLQEVMYKYSPPTENDTPRHIQNIMRIGSRTGGDPASLFLNLGAAGRSAPSSTPSLNAASRPAAPAAPRAATPNVIVLPVPVNAGGQQQTSAASPANSIVPAIDTTYPENFLALYSKLTYQIV